MEYIMNEMTAQNLHDLPPSAKLVFTVLEHEGELTQQGVAKETMLPIRTARYALNRLEDIGAVDRRFYFADARQNIYWVD